MKKKSWPDIIIISSVVLLLIIAYFSTVEIQETEDRLIQMTQELGSVLEFREDHPGSKLTTLKLAPKGIWNIKNDVDTYSDRYESDPLVIAIKQVEAGEVFPDWWIIAVSENAPVREKNYIAPHPEPPVLFIFIENDIVIGEVAFNDS